MSSPRVPSAVDAFGDTRVENSFGGKRRNQDRKYTRDIRATAECEFERANWAVTLPRRHRIQASCGQSKCRMLGDLDCRRKGRPRRALTLPFFILHSSESQQSCGENSESEECEERAAIECAEVESCKRSKKVREGGEKKCAGTCKKFDGLVHPAADGSAESAANWSARISARGDCGEAQFPPMGMELGHEGGIHFGALFQHSKSSKNGYKTRDYKDRLRRNVAVALLQILQPHRTTYMTSWQVGFVELALAGAPIHWARILWKATRQHAQEEKGGSINHLSPFLINFYW
ncbi:hypothetical protein AXG93_1953s1350 [Marchantia polymorpha subsp. ruderalis]|uniref:Uncharacterized protein n=1 Tax=Marchantia polymorpha subsp. ruderalis TaxID=1480154 RepID=A0A176VSW4_MARPO|nr:hypothetical protein AXG93_1953s1350 [Marchantia polymorpha subsp. ruderalis]